MPTTAETFGLEHDTYAPGYSRKCPSCGSLCPTGKMTLRCWYLHDEDHGGGKRLATMPTSDIASILGLSPDAVRRSWRYLVDTYEAPPKSAPSREPQEAYHTVVHYLRRLKQSKHAPKRGWTQRLANDLHLTRQRISQLRLLAIQRGDL